MTRQGIKKACARLDTACVHPTWLRKRAGTLLVGLAVCLSVYVAWQAHKENLTVTDKQNDIQAENETLRQRQNVVYAILESDYPLAIMEPGGKIPVWNYAMERLTGYTREEISRLGLEAVMCTPEAAERHKAGVERAFVDPEKCGKLVLVNCEMRNKAGKEFPVRVAVRIVKTPSDTMYAVARVDRESQIEEYGTPTAERSRKE